MTFTPTQDIIKIMNRTWTHEEEEKLCKLYPEVGQKKCAELLNKSQASVRMKVYRMRLTSTRTKLLSDETYKERLIGTEYSALEPYKGLDKKILHIHNKCGYKWLVIPNNLLRGSNCPKCSKKPYSKIAIKWLESISASILHAENGGEQIIAGYKVDGYDPSTNIVYEFHGDVYHGNLDRFDPEDTPHPYNNLTADQLWDATFEKMNNLSKVSNVIYIWENDYLNGKPEYKF